MCLARFVGTLVSLLCGAGLILLVRAVFPDTNFDDLTLLATIGVWLLAFIVATAAAYSCIGLGNAVTDRVYEKIRSSELKGKAKIDSVSIASQRRDAKGEV